MGVTFLIPEALGLLRSYTQHLRRAQQRQPLRVRTFGMSATQTPNSALCNADATLRPSQAMHRNAQRTSDAAQQKHRNAQRSFSQQPRTRVLRAQDAHPLPVSVHRLVLHAGRHLCHLPSHTRLPSTALLCGPIASSYSAILLMVYIVWSCPRNPATRSRWMIRPCDPTMCSYCMVRRKAIAGTSRCPRQISPAAKRRDMLQTRRHQVHSLPRCRTRSP